jgi:hypothetical protein
LKNAMILVRRKNKNSWRWNLRQSTKYWKLDTIVKI